MRKIGVLIAFSNENRDNKIMENAKQLGFDVEFFTLETLTQEKMDECEVFYGMGNRKFLNHSKNLKWLQLPFAGVDKYVGVENIKNGKILLTNSSGAYGITISEHMIASTLMLMRNMHMYYDLQKNSTWQPLGNIKSIMNSKITIIGMGDIGENFAKRVKAMGAVVTGVRRNADIKHDCVDFMYSTKELEKSIIDADVIALCLPETDETKMIIGKREISLMKNDAIIVNVGRGSAIDQDALIDALNNEKIGGAALDVVVPEPLPADSPLWNCKNILITPHVSGNTSLPLTCDILIDIFCDNLNRYAKGEKLNNIIDCIAGY